MTFQEQMTINSVAAEIRAIRSEYEEQGSKITDLSEAIIELKTVMRERKDTAEAVAKMHNEKLDRVIETVSTLSLSRAQSQGVLSAMRYIGGAMWMVLTAFVAAGWAAFEYLYNGKGHS